MYPKGPEGSAGSCFRGTGLYLLIKDGQPELASKITGMLLELDNAELLLLLDSTERLQACHGQ